MSYVELLKQSDRQFKELLPAEDYKRLMKILKSTYSDYKDLTKQDIESDLQFVKTIKLNYYIFLSKEIRINILTNMQNNLTYCINSATF